MVATKRKLRKSGLCGINCKSKKKNSKEKKKGK
jgi:hypothetical protein